MIEILRWLTIGSRKHAEEDELLRLLDGELGTWHAARVLRHIEQCWTCRGRYEAVQGAICDFVEVRKRMIQRHFPLPENARNRFLRTLEELEQEARQPWSVRALHFLRRTVTPMRSRAFATLLIAFAMSAAIVAVWQRNAQRDVPTVSASELLNRAQVWDNRAANSTGHGVVRQQLAIRTASGKFNHSLYRDVEGRRRPSNSPDVFKQGTLEKASLSGGINWERPLSATDFRKWDEHLPQKKDEVIFNRNGTLTLRTTTTGSDVAEQSLTVRDTDFHPVARRLLLRDLGEVEIAELSYEVLPWQAVDVSQWFVTDAPATAILPMPSRRPTIVGPSSAALDGAELRARLALNTVGADTGENLFLEHTTDSVTVRGFVETQARKREIDDSLAGIPLVSSSVSTFEHRAHEARAQQAPPRTVRSEDVVVQKSPLETYLAARLVSSPQDIQLSRDLIDQALEIDRQALALNSLETRYSESARKALSPENRSLLQQLMRRHEIALLTAIQKERELIKPYVGGSEQSKSEASESISTTNLLRLANHIRQLAGNLLAPGKDGQRSGEAMLAELAESLEHCERVANRLSTVAWDSHQEF